MSTNNRNSDSLTKGHSSHQQESPPAIGTLNRYASAPALRSTASSSGNSSGGQLNAYQAYQPITSKTSYESLDSSFSLQSGQSSATSPWTPSGYNSGQFSAAVGTPTGAQQARISSSSSSRAPGSSSFLLNDPFSQESFGLGFDRSSSSILDMQVADAQRANDARTAFNSAVIQTDKSYLELMIKNLQKTVADKDNEINDLKTRLDALVTAITWDSSAQANKGVADALEGMSYDTLEVAHRIVSRLRTLKEENDSLGLLLSQGRAAQMKSELEILRQENDELRRKLRAATPTSRHSEPGSA